MWLGISIATKQQMHFHFHLALVYDISCHFCNIVRRIWLSISYLCFCGMISILLLLCLLWLWYKVSGIPFIWVVCLIQHKKIKLKLFFGNLFHDRPKEEMFFVASQLRRIQTVRNLGWYFDLIRIVDSFSSLLLAHLVWILLFVSLLLGCLVI